MPIAGFLELIRFFCRGLATGVRRMRINHRFVSNDFLSNQTICGKHPWSDDKWFDVRGMASVLARQNVDGLFHSGSRVVPVAYFEQIESWRRLLLCIREHNRLDHSKLRVAARCSFILALG